MKLSFPLDATRCETCSSEVAASRTRYADKVDGIPLEVEQVEFRPTKTPGVYETYAMAYVNCPNCGGHHEVRQQKRAIAVHVEQVSECDSCQGPLKLIDKEFTYTDKGEQGPKVEVRGKLVCVRCSSQRDLAQGVATSDFISMEREGRLDLNLGSNDDAALAPPTFTGSELDFVPLPREIREHPFTQFPMLKLLASVLKRETGGSPFAGFRMVFVLHFLTDLLPFTEACLDLGMAPEDAIFFMKTEYQYPHKQAIERWLIGQKKLKVRGVEWRYDYVREQEANLGNDSKKLLIVEDGGYFTPLLHRNQSKLLDVTAGAVEQTTKGLRQTEDWGVEASGREALSRDLEGLMHFPLLSIPDSRIKLKVEPPLIGNQVVHCIQALTNAISLHGARVALLGLGTIGMEVFRHLRAVGARITGYDAVDEGRRAEFLSNGGELARTAAEAVSGKQLVIGCSGKCSVTADVIANLEHGAYLASASSDLVEIDLNYLRDRSIEATRFGIKDQEWEKGKLWGGTRYTLSGATRKDVNLLADGYPVTFWGFPGMPHQGGDLIMSVILVAAAELAARAKSDAPYPNKICRRAVDELGEKYALQSEFSRIYYPETRG